MQGTPEMMMTAAIDAIRQQVVAEMKMQTPVSAPQRRLLTAKEAGVYLGRSEAAIRQMTFSNCPSSATAATSAMTCVTWTRASTTFGCSLEVAHLWHSGAQA